MVLLVIAIEVLGVDRGRAVDFSSGQKAKLVRS